MRRISMTLAAALACIAGVAQAQTPAASAPPRKYVEFTVGPTFGHRSDVSVGAEGGIPLSESFDVFIEGGRMRNVPTRDLDAAANVVANYIGGTGVAKQPVGYFDVGLRYLIPTTNQFEPYVLLGLGAGMVSRRSTFTANGTDVTSQLLDKYGVQLGEDLTGSATKALVAFGLGARFNVRHNTIGDVSYRYGRIFLPEEGLNTNRLQFGIGIRF